MAGFEPFIITRRPEAEAEVFTCTICGHQHHHRRRWRETMADDRRPSGRIVCRTCAAQWGKLPGANFSGLTRGDRRLLQRLDAFRSALQWEVLNGQRKAL